MEITDPRGQADLLRSWKAGRIIMRNGRLAKICRRRWAAPASVARVWFQSRFRRGAGDECILDYHSPRIGGFVVLDYIRSEPGTQFKTFRGACQVLDEIAKRREAVAILAHVSTDAISDRLLLRWGWQRHAAHLNGRHWIKRFYQGYPNIDLDRYLPV